MGMQFDNKKNYQKLMYDLMSPPGMNELKQNAYRNAFEYIQYFNQQGNVTTFQAGKVLFCA